MSYTQDFKSLELPLPSLSPIDFLPDVDLFSDLEQDLEQELAQQSSSGRELLGFAAPLPLPGTSINARACRTENSSDVSRCLQREFRSPGNLWYTRLYGVLQGEKQPSEGTAVSHATLVHGNEAGEKPQTNLPNSTRSRQPKSSDEVAERERAQVWPCTGSLLAVCSGAEI